jgi:hypothetical protein
MIYFLAAVLILIIAALLVRVRLRLEISPERRILFVGLGRSGPEIDFVKREGVLKLFGLRLKRFSLDQDRPDSGTPRPAPPSSGESSRPSSNPPARRRSFRAILEIVPQCLSAFWKYAVGLAKSTIVEEAEAKIEAGFDTPDVTGQAFGYYQAAVAVINSQLDRPHVFRLGASFTRLAGVPPALADDASGLAPSQKKNLQIGNR